MSESEATLKNTERIYALDFFFFFALAGCGQVAARILFISSGRQAGGEMQFHARRIPIPKSIAAISAKCLPPNNLTYGAIYCGCTASKLDEFCAGLQPVGPCLLGYFSPGIYLSTAVGGLVGRVSSPSLKLSAACTSPPPCTVSGFLQTNDKKSCVYRNVSGSNYLLRAFTAACSSRTPVCAG